MVETASSFPLSPQQETLWAKQVSDAEYFRAECQLVLEGPLDEERLRAAVRDALARHETFRTVFEKQPGFTVPFQAIRERAEVQWGAGDREAAIRLELAAEGEGVYRLRVNMPTLLADRRTLTNLAGEIADVYGGAEPGEAMQYVDIAEWRREMLASEESQPGRDFWRRYLRDFPAGRGEARGFAPESVHGALPGELSASLGVFCKTAGCSAAEFYFVCWRTLLWRMGGAADETVALEFDGRKYSELETACGLFARYLPVRGGIEPGMTVREAVARTRSTLAELRDWEDTYPDGASVSAAAAFEYLEMPGAVERDGVRFAIGSVTARSELFPVKLSVYGGAGSFVLEFDGARFPGGAREQWKRCLLTLVQSALADPETTLGTLRLLDEVTYRDLVVERNRTAVSFAVRGAVHEVFEGQAVATPDRAAVRSGGVGLSYRELNESANRLAHHLVRMGVQPGALVGLCLDRGVSMIVALVGILKCGAAYVPLTADQPKARLGRQLAGVAAVVTDEKTRALLPELPVPVSTMDGGAWGSESAANLGIAPTDDALVYVIYTSGSTGTPKGVEVRHSNVLNYSLFMRDLLDLDSEPATMATVSTLAADLGNTCIFPALLSGGCVDAIPHEVSADGEKLRRYAAGAPYDVLKIVPSHLEALLEAGAGAEILPRRFLILGGEAFTDSLRRKIEALQPACEVVNHYGPTETTVGSLTLRLKELGPEDRPTVLPIGKPIANTAVYILDERRELVPPGVFGELYIAGRGVARGYLNQPERTKERFTPEGFGAEREGTMYRTGDLVRYREDGNIEFLGRADDQVKIRGFRVELGEVEAALAAHEQVRQAVVVARADERGAQRLLAYVTVNRESGVGAAALRAWLKERLPEHMIPVAFTTLPRIPLTPNGKVDRQGLPEPAVERGGGAEVSPPESPTEAVIAGVWAEVLRRDAVARDDNFFDLGGHSLLATQVVSRLRRSLEMELQLRTMFDCPTVRSLAEYVDRARREGAPTAPPTIARVPRTGPLPLSFIQRRMWVIDRLQPGNPVYNIPRTLRLQGPLDVSALKRAVAEVVRRHESQRTTFPAKDGEPVQAIAEHVEIPLPVVDVSGLPKDERETAARRLAREEALVPFDLEAGPLLRTKLLRLGEEDHVFLSTVHHIVSDGWSAGIFLSELSRLYDAFTQGKPSPLPELAIQCADHAVWQRGWFEGDVLRAQTDWWREHLRGAAPVLRVPGDRERTEEPMLAGASEAIPLSRELGQKLRELNRREDVTPFITMLAAYQALLSRYTGQEHIVIGTDVANRTLVEVEPLIGCFINVLALHTDLSGNPTFRELLGRVRKTALAAWAHQDMPFDKLVDELQPERSLTHNPIVQVLFVMQNIPAAKREMGALQVVSFPMPVNFSKFDLALFVAEREGVLTGNWVYRTDLFERETIQRFARQYETLLHHAVTEPETRVQALPLQSAEERERDAQERDARKQQSRKALLGTAPKPAGV